jgi:MFS family permease
MTLAFGLGTAIFTGLLPLQVERRLLARVAGVLLSVGAMLTALAVVVDALQPWQRQAGWAHDWWGALGWRFAPLAWLGIGGGVAVVVHALRSPLQRVWERAFVLRGALLVGLLCGGVALLVGKVVACLVILAVALMFLLEYRLGGRDWGYPYEGNGVAH